MNIQPVEIHTLPHLKELAVEFGNQLVSAAAGLSFHIITAESMDEDYLSCTEKKAPCFYIGMASDIENHSRIISLIKRFSPYDVLLTTGRTFDDIRQGSVIGVHGAFRERQIKHLALHADIVRIDVSLKQATVQLGKGVIDGLIISDADSMLFIPDTFRKEVFSPQFFIPPPFQGIVCVQAGHGTESYHSLISNKSSLEISIAYQAEALFRQHSMDQHQPYTGALCIPYEDKFIMYASIISSDGTGFVQGTTIFTEQSVQDKVTQLSDTILFHAKDLAVNKRV